MTLPDIKLTIIEILEAVFPYKVYEDELLDTTKQRPCFFLYLEQATRSSASTTKDLKTYTVLIQFQKKNNDELLEMGDQMEEVFLRPIKFGDRTVLIDQSRTDIVDNNLFFEFQIRLHVPKSNTKTIEEIMKEIQIKHN